MESHYRFRLYLLTALILMGCGTLLSRLYEFQIDRRSQFAANVPTTHTVTIREPAVRGDIVDRNGLVLARNRRSYEIIFNLEDIYRSYREHEKIKEKDQSSSIETLDDLEELDDSPPPDADSNDSNLNEAEIERIVKEWIVPKLESFGLTGERFIDGIRSHYLTHGGLVPYVYRRDLTPNQFAQIAVRTHELPGVEVRVMPRREYPYGALGSHILGYVRQWAKGDELPEEFRGQKNIHFQGDEYGVAGVELTANDFLTGEGGKRVLVRNEKRKVIATDDYQAARQGAEVQLTIDAEIQMITESVLRQIGRGAAVVMDPNTGEILALASVPNFDPNDFIPAISQEKWDHYRTNRADPLTNNAISAFLPGSTFKLPTALAGIMHGKTNYGHNCIGYNSFGANLRIRCWKTAGHGFLRLSEATQRSCNPYFMSLAGDLGATTMADTFNLLGFGRTTGLLLPQEAPGLVPGTTAWKRKNPGATMTRANLALLAIGQGESLASPLQICSVTATIANGGRVYQPRIIRRVVKHLDRGQSLVLKENIPVVKDDLHNHGLTDQGLNTIRQGMWKAVNEKGGTAQRVAMKNVFIAAKTGTAQFLKNDPENTHIAWTTSYAPFDSPRYAVCVMVVNGKSGGAVAGTLSHLIYREIFNMEAGLKPRLSKLTTYAGNFESYEELPLPEGSLYAFADADEGETGDEIEGDLLDQSLPVRVQPGITPTPTIAPTPDQP